MAFDLNTATPVDAAPEQAKQDAQATSGFDISSAQPVEPQVVHVADKNMTIEVPPDMPEHQIVNTMRDHVYGNDQVPAVPEEGKKPFMQAMVDKLQLGYGNGLAGMAHILGVDKNAFMKSILFNDQDKAFLNAGTDKEDNPYKQFGYHFSEGVGGLLSTLPLFIGTGEAAVGSLIGRVPAVVSSVLTKIPSFAIGAGIFGGAAGAQKYASAGPEVAALGAVQGAAENVFWNTLYGNAGKGLSMFPKMIGINVANTTYEAAKQNRLPNTKELYTSAADGIAYAAVFSLMGHFMDKTNVPEEKQAFEQADTQIRQATLEGDAEKPAQVMQELVNNQAIRPEVRQGIQEIFERTKSETTDHALTMAGIKPVEEEAQKDGQDVSRETSKAKDEDKVLTQDDINASKAPEVVKSELTKVNQGRELSEEEVFAQKHVLENPDKAMSSYVSQSKKEFNADNIISADIGKFAVPGMKSTLSYAYHEAGSALAKARERELLDNPDTKDLPVGFSAGGAGAGKSHTLRELGKDLQNDYALVHDTNLNNFDSAKSKIDRALSSGRNVEVMYVYRDPVKAFSEGVIPRVRTQNRIVPIKDHIETHLGVRPTIEKIVDNYSPDKVTVESILNTGAKNDIKIVPLAEVPKIEYTRPELENKLYDVLKDSYDQGKITQPEFSTALQGSPHLQARATEEGYLSAESSGGSTEGQGKALSRLSSQSGQIDTSTIPGVDAAAEKITSAADFLKRSQKYTPISRDLAKDFYLLQSQAKADELRAKTLLESYQLKPEDDAAIYRYADNIDVHGEPRNATLTPEQQKVYDEVLKPLQEARSLIYSNLRNQGFPVDKELQLPRQVIGKGGTFDRLKEGFKGLAGSILRKTAPEFKDRIMKVLTTDTGARVVAAVKRDGVTAFNDGTATSLGPLKIKTYGDLREGELSDIDAKEEKLKSEYGILTTTGKRMQSSPQRIRNIESDIVDLDNQRQEVIDKYAEHDLNDEVFIDKNGKQWNVSDATVDEIEKNTNLQYYKNPILNTLDSYLRLRRVERATQFLEAFKNAPDFNKIGVRYDGGTAIPEGWKPINMPQFRGYAFEPRVADTMDSFYTKMKTAEDPANLLTGLNRFLRTSIFFNPLIHIPNISVHWAVNRGIVKWFMPTEYATLFRTSLRAIDAVIHQNSDYVDMLDHGANLLYQDVSGDKIHDIMLKKMGEELNSSGALRENVAKALGYVNPANLVKAIYSFSSKATWSVNDIATMQAVYEEMHGGRTMDEAVQEASKHIPDYRVPARILDSKALAEVLKNPNLTMFGAYHYGALKSYGEMIKSLVNVKNDPKGAAESIDKLAMLGLIGLVIYPLLDNVARQVTGNQDASFRRAGATTFPMNTYNLLKGKTDFASYIFGIVTPSPLLKSATELTLNRDLFTGKNIYQQGEVGSDLLNYAKKQVSPVGQVERITSGKATAKEAGLGLVGIKSPHQMAHTDAEQAAMNIMHTKNFGGGEMTPDEQQKHIFKQNLAASYAKSKDEYELVQAFSDGEISKREATQIKKEAGMPPIVRMTKQMSVKEVQKVFKSASQEEKDLLIPVLKRKIQNKIKTSSQEDKVKLKSLLESIKDL